MEGEIAAVYSMPRIRATEFNNTSMSRRAMKSIVAANGVECGNAFFAVAGADF